MDINSAKGSQRVEIREKILKLVEEGSFDEDKEEQHETEFPGENSRKRGHLFPKAPKRNAMGEYIPADGEKPLTRQGFCGPGPSSYTPLVAVTKRSPPQYSIVGKPKEKQECFVPGPNHYDTRASAMWNRKTKTLKAKLKTSPYSTNPREHLTCSMGSAAYKVEYYDTGKHAPQCTMGTQYDGKIVVGPPNSEIGPVDTKGFAAPGPNYLPYDCRGMEKSIGLRYKEAQKVSPGPATYTLPDLDRGPKYSLRDRYKERPGFDVPGPGTYEIKSKIGSGTATSIQGRQREARKYYVPGPDSYFLPALKDGPKHSMTYRAFETEVEETPGPANYSHSSTQLWRTPAAYSCRQQCKPSFPTILNYPEHGLMKNEKVGPETYDAGKGFAQNSSPACSIGTRRPQPENLNPGPGHYHISLSCRPDSFKAPEFSMGKALEKEQGTIGPGPAAYHSQNMDTTSGYSMSSRPKLKQVRPIPAPNAYKILKGQTSKGINNGSSATFKSRASPYVYSGFPNLTRVTT